MSVALLYARLASGNVIIQSYAGQEASGCPYVGARGDVFDALSHGLAATSEISFDSNGNAYYAVWECGVILYHERTTNLVSMLAGYPGAAGWDGDGGQATAALVGQITAMKLDPDERYLYLGDSSIRRIDLSTQIITHVAGQFSGYHADRSGDNGAATSALLGPMHGFHFNTSRYMFISDTMTRIRRIDWETNIITNYAGSVYTWHGFQDGPLTSALFDQPTSIWGADGKGMTVYDTNTCAFRKIDMVNGIVSTWWGGSDCYSHGDGGSIVNATAYTNVKICGTDRAGMISDCNYTL